MADPRPSSAPGRRPRAVAWMVWTSVVALLYVVLRVDGPFSALDFPLNDDWAFARTVLTLLQTGRFELTEWVGMAFVPQALWGAGVSSLVGFSFNTLRVSVLILAAACLAIFEPWMRSFGIERRQAAIGACVLGFNPVFFALANSFMTDVPFLLLFIGTLALVPRGGGVLSLTIFAAACVVLTLQRHVGLAIPAAWALYRGLRLRAPPTERLVAVIPLIAAAAAYVGLRDVLQRTTGMPGAFNSHIDALLQTLRSFDGAAASGVAMRTVTLLCFLGLFSLPISVAVWSDLGWRTRALAVVLAITITRVSDVWHLQIPMTHNVWIDGGIGPLTLRDKFAIAADHTYGREPAWLKRDLVWFAAVGASLLAVAAARVARSGSDRRRLLLVVMAVYAAPIVVTGFFDRYLLPLLALAIVLVGSGDRRAWYWGIAGVAGSAALALVALAGTHEYLSWNRARWQALNELTDAQRIAPAEIDGGIEFDGWHFCQKHACASAPGKPWWYVQDDRWLIAFGPVEGYEEVFRVPYPRFGLSGRTMESLRALHRIEAPPASPEG